MSVKLQLNTQAPSIPLATSGLLGSKSENVATRFSALLIGIPKRVITLVDSVFRTVWNFCLGNPRKSPASILREIKHDLLLVDPLYRWSRRLFLFRCGNSVMKLTVTKNDMVTEVDRVIKAPNGKGADLILLKPSELHQKVFEWANGLSTKDLYGNASVSVCSVPSFGNCWLPGISSGPGEFSIVRSQNGNLKFASRKIEASGILPLSDEARFEALDKVAAPVLFQNQG